MRVLWVVIMAAVLCPAGLAAGPGTLRVGEYGALAEAKLPPKLKEAIYVALVADYSADDLATAGRATVFVRRIGPGPRYGVEVTVPSEWCGATGNCGIKIFDGRTGAVLLDDDGFDFRYERRMHHGVRDIAIRANMSCCEGTRHEYRFDGKGYTMVRDVREMYDEELGAGKVTDAPR